MRNNHLKLSVYTCCFLFFFTINSKTLFAQVKKSTSINKVEREIFNFIDNPVSKRKQKKNKELRVVYSDRYENISYLDPYALKQGNKQDFLTPYYVINEKNNFLEIVKSDVSLLGKPKGLFSFFYSGKYNFKDSKKAEYIGWVHKSNLLLFSHPKISEYNYRPMRYVAGIHELNTLFNIKKHVIKDSIHLYQTPKLKNKITKKLVLNQFVYLYKQNITKTAALVSNLDNMHPADSTKRIMGWVPVQLIKEIGQLQVLNTQQTDSLFFLNPKDSKHSYLSTKDVASDFLYIKDKIEEVKIDTLQVSVPLNVWNHYDNKLINVEGNDILIRDLAKVRKENKLINFHYIFDCNYNLKEQQTQLISSLQRIWMQISENPLYKGYEFSFSASSYGCDTFYKFPKSKSFALWVDYIQKAILRDPSISTSEINNIGINKSLDYSLSDIETPSFTNNIIMIVGSKKFENLTNLEALTKKLALSSSRLIFYQLENKAEEEYQDYILQAKNILSTIGSKYASFLKAFTVENRLVKEDNVFIKIPSEDNMYIYDTPENSIYQGGLVFPKINKKLYSESFDIAVDTILTKTLRFNNMFINSLELHAEKLGFLRSKPGNRMKKVIQKDTTFNENLIPKHDMYASYYEDRNFNSKENSKSNQGYLLSKSELEVLIEGYRSLSPKISEEITKKDRKFIYKLYKENIKGINKNIFKKELKKSSSLAEMFFLKTGFPVQVPNFKDIKISDLLCKRKVSDEQFLNMINYMRTKTEDLVKYLDTAKGVDVKGEKSKYYFITLEKTI